MISKEELIKITGSHQLFLGIPTYSWSLAQFQQAAQFAKAHGVDSLLVKVADGANEWYGGPNGWDGIRNTILAEGVGAIPYVYSYGNKFGALDTEINIMLYYMDNCGIVCMNAEAEWNGQVSWAQHLCSRMQPVPGTFLVSTWANPSVQNWLGVIQALAPCTTVFMPQQYNDSLATYWPEFGTPGATWLQPTVNVTGDPNLEPNDPVAIARNAYTQGHTGVSVWYYEAAVANPELLDTVLEAFPKTSGGGNTLNIPANWTDDGTLLKAPNGHTVRGAIRSYLLANNWNANDVPLAEEERVAHTQDYYPSESGWRQIFNYTLLVCDEAGNVQRAGIGNELLGCRRDRATFKQALLEANTRIEALQAQLDAQPSSGIVTKLRALFTLHDEIEAALKQ